ncbi:hypothetical protein ACIO3O_02030 [Streptomyces sp. NPDC087440]|uniref:hypothetical protein n=1 Tax=Streptomyces sp. NPDC087440 TaxID=3365790 RepID=UPI00380E7186
MGGTGGLLELLLAFGGIGLISLLPMLVIRTPAYWCRTCKHQREDHAGGTGECSGDEFPAGEFAPGGTCACSAYVPNRREARGG